MSIFSRYSLYVFNTIRFTVLKLIYNRNIIFSVRSLLDLRVRFHLKGNKTSLFFGKYIRAQRMKFSISSGTLKVSDMSYFGENSLIEVNNGTLDIGKNVFMNRNCMIVCCEYVKIGDGTAFGANVSIYDHDHKIVREGNQNWSDSSKSSVIIGNNVWIGANTIILKGTSIGDNSVIAAGSVIKGSIPSHTIAIQKRETTFKTIDK